jgi:predicted dinucleotide-binding enzyme
VRLVKAFGNLTTGVIVGRATPRLNDQIVVPMCGDDSSAKMIVGELIASLGFAALNLGALRQSPLLEPGGKFFGAALTLKEARSVELTSFLAAR